MYFLRLYELTEINHGHRRGSNAVDQHDWPGFLNLINWYYGYRVWR